jgi:hypothetical protein
MTTAPTFPRPNGVLLRTATAEDDPGLIRLARLDGARTLVGPVLIAEENGTMVAALCLSTGRAVADPFVPSLHLIELLRHYEARRQVPGGSPGRGGLLPRLAFLAG